ncbi:MAG: hypothetical protein AB7T59_04985 [Hyphomonadaceae bacterium]
MIKTPHWLDAVARELKRHCLRHVRKQEWTAIAIDFAIVVIGVFVGIQVANWNEARRIAAEAILAGAPS